MKASTEQDYYEIDMLLGEIPNMTSGNTHSEDSISLKPTSAKENIKPSSSRTPSNFYSGSQAGSPIQKSGFYNSLPLENCNSLQDKSVRKFENNGNVNEFGTRDCLPSNGNTNLEDSSLPDDQSLAYALAQLSFKDGLANGDASSHLINHGLLRNGTILWEDQYQNNSSVAHASLNNGIQENRKFAGQQHCLPLYAGMTPLVQSIPSMLALPHNYVPSVGFPSVPYQQQCVFETQPTSIPYVQQQITRSHIPWPPIDDENYNLIQQCRYMSQFQNPYQTNLMTTNGNARQSHVNMYNSLQMDQTNSMQYLGGGRTRNFPKKILTKSGELNMLKAINGSSNASNGLVCRINSERLLSSNHFQRSMCNSRSLSTDSFHHTLTSGSLHLDGRLSSGSSPDSLGMYSPRSQPPKYTSLDEIVGNIYHLAKDQHGCRFLQKKSAEGCPEDIEKIFVEIIDHIVELMTDPFGNYLVQKLLEVCTNEQMRRILNAITRRHGDLVRISLDMHGTRAIQKVIETLSTPEQFSLIVSSLKPGIVNLMKDSNGNHVAQRCLQHLPPEYKEYLFGDVVAHCSRLAKDRHACCVLQKCLSHCDGEHRHRLVCAITSDALHLSQNQYGNYVVQYVLELELPWATAALLDKLEGSYGYLSMQKCSSNVVEKCILYGEDRRGRIVQELISDCRFDQILQDPYGNYVIQVALRHTKGVVHATLVEAIKPHVPALRTSPYGKKILSCNGLKK